MKITQDFIDSICDDEGLTKGQEYLLARWGGNDYMDKDIPDLVANFLVCCKGYRQIEQRIKDFKGWL
jgi:hypothetical protein